MSCFVSPYPALHKNWSNLYLIARGGDVFLFCSETHVSSMRHISELMVPGFDRPMQLSGVRLACFDSWLYTCVMAFRYIDNTVMTVDVVNS